MARRSAGGGVDEVIVKNCCTVIVEKLFRYDEGEERLVAPGLQPLHPLLEAIRRRGELGDLRRFRI